MTDEYEWLLPAIILTAVSGAAALIMMPDWSGVMPAALLLPDWMLASAFMAGLAGLVKILIMMRNGVSQPIEKITRFLVRNRKGLSIVLVGIFIAGLNMITFMWTKPLLNYLVPFWADPHMAAFDRAIFQTDPWKLVSWLNHWAVAPIYHRGWFALMILTLLLVLAKPSSRVRSALLLSYFILWSVAGPVVHIALPTAGPVFYERLGYGSDFTNIPLTDEMTRMGDYLWAIYSERSFGPGAGISAMPSLHIATTTWCVLAFAYLYKRWVLPIGAFGFLIFMMSVSLGWHYAVDGIVGSILAVLSFAVAYRFMRNKRSEDVPHVQTEVSTVRS